MAFEHSNDIPVEDLARGLRGLRAIRSVKKSFSIPFAFVLLFFIVFILALAILPTCLVVFSAVTNATSDLSTKTANSVILSTTSELTNNFGSVKLTTDIFLGNPSTKRVMENLSKGYGMEQDINLAAQLTLDASPFTQRIVCVQRFNISGNAPVSPVPGTKILPLMQWYYDLDTKNFTALWCDYSNSTDCFFAGYDTKRKSLIPPVQSKALMKPIFVEKGFIAQELNNCTVDGGWQAEATYGFPMYTYAKCARPINSTTPPLYSCGSAFFGFAEYPEYPGILRKVAPTKETRVILTDTLGSVLISSLNETQFPTIKTTTVNGQNVTSFVLVSEYSDKVTSQIGKQISPSNSWKEVDALAVDPKTLEVTNSKTAGNEYILNDNSKWIVTIARMSFYTPEKFYLILAIPRSELFETVDGSIRTGITLSSVFTIVGLIVGFLVTIGIVWPLQTLTKDMRLATTYNFSSLSAGGLRMNSVFTEVQTVQKAFNIMVQAFAGAIQRNRASRFGKFDTDDSNYTGTHELTSITNNSRYYTLSTEKVRSQ
ncbi:hypothetical protein HK098_006900 [Nowakowskiella sp. JEL0407]|nr:hypothetical protein HK098_006900 [Nowakowskiella sp. JEL0407]